MTFCLRIKVYLSILVSLIFSIGVLGLQPKTVWFAHHLLTSPGKPSECLLKLLQFLGIEHDGSLKSIVDQTQKAWLRPVGKERWEMEQKSENLKNSVIPLCTELGMIDQARPSRTHYRYVLVLGALAERVKSRLSYLVMLCNQGITFDELVFLSGARPLHATLESEQVLRDCVTHTLLDENPSPGSYVMPTTEYEMMRYIFENAGFPASWYQLPVTWINIPMLPNTDGSLRRPTTEDTILGWLDHKPEPGSCLVISNQPFVGYQDAVVRSYLDDSFFIDTVGSQASSASPVVLFLDTAARILYQEQKRLALLGLGQV